MKKQTELLEIAHVERNGRVADVIFVHGLNGDAHRTWKFGRYREKDWPRSLGEAVPEVAVWSLDYLASSTAWLGHAMDLHGRAENILELLTLHRIGEKPAIFVCHSLGGLVIKAVLRRSHESTDPERRRLACGTRGIVFLATPNLGARLADLVLLAPFYRPTAAVKALASREPELVRLNRWYRDHHQSLGIANRVYVESRRVFFVRVVDELSGDPGLPGVAAIPIDANHLEITRPLSERAIQFLGVLDFVRQHAGLPRPDFGPKAGEVARGPDRRRASRLASPRYAAILSLSVLLLLSGGAIGLVERAFPNQVQAGTIRAASTFCLLSGLGLAAVSFLAHTLLLELRRGLSIIRGEMRTNTHRYYRVQIHPDELEILYTHYINAFGPNLTPIETMRSWLRKNPTIGWKVMKSRVDVLDNRLVGYFDVLPLTKVGVRKIEQDRADARTLTLNDIMSKNRAARSYYIGSVGSLTQEDNAKVLVEFIDFVKELAQKAPGITLYARPVTDPGLRLLTRNGFEPIGEQDGVWRRTLAEGQELRELEKIRRRIERGGGQAAGTDPP